MDKREFRFDPNSDTWFWIKEKMEAAMELDRRALERDLDEKQTAKLRGRIEAFRVFIEQVNKLTQPK